jgi:cysteine-rich repeat protein
LLNGDFLGSSAVNAKDIDGDGVADLVIGARRDDDGGSNRGAVWVAILDGVPGAFCGDDVLDPNEDCDDGNELNGDCCDDGCAFDPATTPCPNGNVCDGDEVCDGSGGCGSGSPLDCDDSEPCTQDICDPINGCESTTGPATMCLLPGKQKFDVVNKTNPKSDKVKWKWQKGEETFLTDFGNPAAAPLTEYVLCIYDTSAGTPSLIESIDITPGSNWVLQAGKGYKYKDSAAALNGVKNVQLRAGAAGKSKINFSASGMQLPVPVPFDMTQYFQQDPEVVVQLVNDLGFCWTSTFGSPAVKNTAELFKDKQP